MSEEWRSIPGWPDYEVSDGGQVVSLKHGRRRLLRDQHAPGGHRRIQIGGAAPKTFFVHQLVMLAFVGPCPEGLEIRHLNGDGVDNRLGNLAYGTRAENIQDQKDHGVHHFAGRTHCPQNHPYDEANTYRDTRGWRACVICKRVASRDAGRRRRARERAA